MRLSLALLAVLILAVDVQAGPFARLKARRAAKNCVAVTTAPCGTVAPAVVPVK